MRQYFYRIILMAIVHVFLVACVSGSYVSDAELKSRVESQIRNAPDLPTGIRVEVQNGLVLLTGSLSCEECGGNATPGRTGTIQQSLGAVVRAVPGVEEIDFDFDS